MKLLTIEQVDNGYVVTNKPDSRGSDAAIYVTDESGIHVFETFASMGKWLEGHFARDPEPMLAWTTEDGTGVGPVTKPTHSDDF